MTATTCFRHPDRETGRACTRCGRAACADCLRAAPVGSHCVECIREARPPARERLRRWNAAAGPIVTVVIIALNGVVFVLTASTGGALGRGGSLQERLALFGPGVAEGGWYRLFTSGFVHYGVIHIAFNMLLLYRFGGMLEPALGRVRFVGLYVVSLLGGSFGAVLLTPHAFTAGASGAVFGLVGAVAVGMRQRGINVWQSGVGGLIVINLVFTFLIPGISVGGHLGGLAAGSAAGAAMLRSRPTRASALAGAGLCLVLGVVAVAGSIAASGAASG